MNKEVLPIESIRERDIDIILLEELNVNDKFCDWFVKQVGLPNLTVRNGVWRSISDYGLGETDILFSYQSQDTKVFVLIENKLDTSFQENQYQRYVERGIRYSKKECDEAYPILIAPKSYCDKQNDFKDFVTYEMLAQWFEEGGSSRDIFKSQLIKIGIEKLRRGYQPVNSIPVQAFWKNYWEYKESNFPSFIMKKPDIVPYNSDTTEMRHRRLKQIIFYHKLSRGYVDMSFCDYPADARYQVEEIKPEDAELILHNKRFSLRMYVEQVDRTKDFKQQVEVVNEALNKLDELKQWAIERKVAFFLKAETISPQKAEFIQDMKEAVDEVKQIKAGKSKGISANNLLDEL